MPTDSKGSALAARYRRVMRHRGHKNAIVAVAHAVLVTAYHLLSERVTWRAVQALEHQGNRTLERVA